MLDDRKAAILRAVVEEYIDPAQPVGSAHVVKAADVKVSSATVRNRSEEHTSELQSLMRTSYAVFCLKKKTRRHNNKAKRNPHVEYIQNNAQIVLHTIIRK